MKVSEKYRTHDEKKIIGEQETERETGRARDRERRTDGERGRLKR